MKNQKTKFVILGLLTIKPLSGYDIKKRIETSVGHFWSESNGQLYPTLKKLVKEQCIRFEAQQGKKVRHLYSITEIGLSLLKQWLEDGEESKTLHRDEELLKLFFGNNSSMKTSAALIQKREKRVQERLEEYRLLQKELEDKTFSPHYQYWNLCLKNGVYHAEAELRWCRESIQALSIKGTS